MSEESRQYNKKWEEFHKVERQIYRKEYKKTSKAKSGRNRYERDRRKNDPIFRLRQDISRIVKRKLSKLCITKDDSVSKYIDYTMQELKSHLEKQFESWMNWNNQGKYIVDLWDDNDPSTWTWQVDHIIPQSNFDFSNKNDIKKCWALDNLRPYPSKMNIVENDRT